jgi:hypothetical protein
MRMLGSVSSVGEPVLAPGKPPGDEDNHAKVRKIQRIREALEARIQVCT